MLAALQGALQRDRPSLLTLLQEQLLPVLVDLREPPTPTLLAWLAGAEDKQDDVREIAMHTKQQVMVRFLHREPLSAWRSCTYCTPPASHTATSHINGCSSH